MYQSNLKEVFILFFSKSQNPLCYYISFLHIVRFDLKQQIQPHSKTSLMVRNDYCGDLLHNL